MKSSIIFTIILIIISAVSIAALVMAALIIVKVSDKKDDKPQTNVTDGSTLPFSGSSTSTISASTTSNPIPPGWQKASDLFLSSIDRSIDPCQDFYSYSCNKWTDSHTVDSTWFSITESIVNHDAIKAIRSIDNSPVSKTDRTLKQIKSLFDGCEKNMNSSSKRAIKIYGILQEYGGWPILKSDWSWINDVPSKYHDFSYTMGWFYAFYQLPIFLIPDIYRGQYLQINGPSFSMTYCDQNPLAPSWTILRKFMFNVTLTLAREWNVQVDEAKINRDVDDMVELAQKMCNISQLADNLTLVNVDEAQKKWPNINWKAYFKALLVDVFGYENISNHVQKGFYITTPQYLTEFDQNILPTYQIDNTSRRIFQNYLLWRLIVEYVQYMGPLFKNQWNQFVHEIRKLKIGHSKFGIIDSSKKFVGHQLTSTDDSCLKMVNDAATFAVGRAYVDYIYGTDQTARTMRQEILNMTIEIMQEFRVILKNLTWMDDQSKDNAQLKVDYLIKNALNQEFAFDNKKLNTYYRFLNNLLIDSALFDIFETKISVQQHQFSSRLLSMSLNGTTDRYDWGDTEINVGPLTVNAWYQFTRNSITIPAGILKSPFYLKDFPYAVNFGALGMIIGHELTHGFDNRGQQFDIYGNENTWISPESMKKFRSAVKCVDDQYAQYCYNISSVNETMCINPDNTEEENLADNGGLKAAYVAYMATRPKNEESEKIPGFEDLSMEQIFFLSFSQIWCEWLSEQNLVLELGAGSHSPNRYRVIGTLRNFEPFAKAWKCRKGDFMYPNETCSVW